MTKYLKYEGNFKNGTLHGIGLILYTDGAFFHGEFSNNMRNGPGVLVIDKDDGAADLIFYTFWKDNKPEGNGLLQVPGSSYFGDFSNGLRHGKGLLINEHNGRPSYDGNWVKNKKEGHGNEWYENGKRYIGEFKNDLRDGIGVET